METFMLVAPDAARNAALNEPHEPPADPDGDLEAARLKRRLRELAAELVDALEATRQHLARELHDGVGAELTAAHFALANLENTLADALDTRAATALDIAQRSLGAACEASRRVVEAFHAPAFDGNLVATLAQWKRSFAKRTGLAVSLACDPDMRVTQLSPHAALAVFRVAQEALGNVAKHAGASRADVRLKADAQHLSLIVTDDGRGLSLPVRSLAPAGAGSGGFGLAGMRARCEAFDGTLHVRSNAPRVAEASGSGRRQGTTVHASFAWAAVLETRDRTPSLENRSLRHSGQEESP